MIMYIWGKGQENCNNTAQFQCTLGHGPHPQMSFQGSYSGLFAAPLPMVLTVPARGRTLQ